MFILIISDTHGSIRFLQKAMDKYHLKPDLCIHAGDILGQKQMVEKTVNCPLVVVRGNCDIDPEIPVDKVVEAGSHKIYVCHGHQYGVGANRFRLKNEARLRGCDIAIYGHTHVLDIDNSDPDVLCINPGSLLIPRDFGSPSYVAMSIDEQNRVSCNAFRVDF
jgi:putative phosphoesterase